MTNKTTPTYGSIIDPVTGMKRTCSITGCELNTVARGLCKKHYMRLRYHKKIPRIQVGLVCTMPECGKKAAARSLCSRHYRYLLNTEKKKRINDKYNNGVIIEQPPLEKQVRIYACFTGADELVKAAINKRINKQKTMQFERAKTRAAMSQHEWSLSADDYYSLVIKPCHYCGQKLSKNGIGLDRKECSKEYEISNVCPCCGLCNRLKSNLLTEDEMVAVCQLLKSMRGDDIWKGVKLNSKRLS